MVISKTDEDIQSRKDEDMVIAFLKSIGLEPIRFAKQDKRKLGKTPDFQVYKNGEIIFYCEVKSLFDDNFEGSRPDPTYNKVSKKIHEAVSQFDSVNPDREYANVLVFVNNEIGTDVDDLTYVFEGNVLTDNGKLPIFKKYSDGRIREEKYRIDLFIWYEKKGEPVFRFIFSSPFKNQLCVIFGIDPNKIN